MTDISVSPGSPADIDAFVASVDGLFHEDGGRHDPFLDTGWPAREGSAYYAGLVDDPSCLLAVARDRDRVVGHLVGKLVGPDSIKLARFAVLESLRVDPDARGQGVGSLLVAEFLAWARRQEAAVASVTAYAGNDGARRFYARHGFAPGSVTMRAPL
jgi:GNAT superfamily N-acetyltransferase